MSSTHGRLFQLLLGCTSLLLIGMVLSARQPVTRAMVGDWRGRGEIVVNWTTQREILIHLTIASTGAVHGTVGDARLQGGRLLPNRGRLGRALDVKTDYIITGRLDGCIVASESVCRESVKIPLNWSQGHFTGGLHTNGTLAGGKDRMVFSVARLSLLPVAVP